MAADLYCWRPVQLGQALLGSSFYWSNPAQGRRGHILEINKEARNGLRAFYMSGLIYYAYILIAMGINSTGYKR